ncbi:MAG: type II/IV secretion system protein [Sedimentisphaerales bacterium]|nr:type II/IV secretion system protein [Sedimentisphaerales bacterium]
MKSMTNGKEKRKIGKDSADVVALVSDVLNQAIGRGASDIHFEPTSRQFLVKYRLDGELQTVDELPVFLSENVITRLKVMGNLLTYRNDVPQEGRIPFDIISSDKSQHQVTDMRLAVFPTIHGQRAVIRIFYEDMGLLYLDQLGLSDYIHTALIEIAGQRQGVLLLTGPAGSGKSTTLGAILRHILTRFPGRSIVALEDPVERVIAGVTQVQITNNSDMTFPVALRSLLRQDPEVLMLGEIRDAETARIAIEAGLTGHLLMSTMHSGSPAGALLRLLEMGIEPYQVTSAISAVLNQRLIRRLCRQCTIQSEPDGHWQAIGCETCARTGFHGRVLIAELVELDGDLRNALLQKTDLDQLENLLRKRGHMTMAQDAQRLVAEGITTQQEIVKVIGKTKES